MEKGELIRRYTWLVLYCNIAVCFVTSYIIHSIVGRFLATKLNFDLQELLGYPGA